jgi:eukaryotic-like serine/threonine-protein kinase
MYSPSNVSNLGLNWSYTTGGPVQAPPAVASGTVYVGSNDGKVYALNATTGALQWSYATGSNVLSSPAVANGIVYIGSNDHKGYAFGLAGGTTGGVRRPVPASLRPDAHRRTSRG